MGIPSFFKWLVHKYPKTLQPAYETIPQTTENGESIQIDLDQPNPNGIEFDNLYLDMNGLVHPCCHSCDPLPESEEDMMLRIFAMVDEVVSLVRPRKVLYLALDGTAPRAKMNQQRSRRFKSAEIKDEHDKLKATLAQRFQSSGYPTPPPKPQWDQNVITPGTDFMIRLTKSLQWYIYERVNSDPYFGKLAVVLSDSNVPGEGEHKIMNYIRACRSRPEYNPNTVHCVYGLDADLVMLALTTHEPYFSIIREHIDWRNPQEKGRNKAYCDPGLSNYDFLHCSIVREYLEGDLVHLRKRPLPMRYDFERCLDDFVFICFFSGNDFLPCLPSLEIREGGLDILLEFYTHHLEDFGGYICDHGEVNMPRLAMLLRVIGDKEDLIFEARCAKNNEKKTKFFKKRDDRQKSDRLDRLSEMYKTIEARRLKTSPEDLFKDIIALNKQQAEDVRDLHPDTIRYSEAGWKERFYKSKFSDVYGEDAAQLAQLDASYHYLLGVQWVMRYYFQGTASWKWYYPYHYPPFASDLTIMAETFTNSPRMEISEPFSPVTQLMGVMPPASKGALPDAAHWFMTHRDSPIKHMYPTKIKCDYEGVKFQWMGRVLLPFVDEDNLRQAAVEVEKKLSPQEQMRNSTTKERVYVHSVHPIATLIENCEQNRAAPAQDSISDHRVAATVKRLFPQNMYTLGTHYNHNSYPISSSRCVIGQIQPLAEQERIKIGGQFDVGYDALGVDPITENQVKSAVFLLPPFHPHSSSLLPDTLVPKPALTEEDLVACEESVFESVIANPNASRNPRMCRVNEGSNAANTAQRDALSLGVPRGRGRGRGNNLNNNNNNKGVSNSNHSRTAGRSNHQYAGPMRGGNFRGNPIRNTRFSPM